jgi:hypothetical protein
VSDEQPLQAESGNRELQSACSKPVLKLSNSTLKNIMLIAVTQLVPLQMDIQNLSLDWVISNG